MGSDGPRTRSVILPLFCARRTLLIMRRSCLTRANACFPYQITERFECRSTIMQMLFTSKTFEAFLKLPNPGAS